MAAAAARAGGRGRAGAGAGARGVAAAAASAAAAAPAAPAAARAARAAARGGAARAAGRAAAARAVGRPAGGGPGPAAAPARGARLSARAAAADAEGEGGGWGQTLLLGSLFALWYFFNIYFNIANKQVLKLFTVPISCTWLQFAVGSLLALSMWGLRVHKAPKVSKELVLKILPLAAVHALGNLLTNVSLGKVAVSFTHTIKAMEPFFSVVLSAIFLGDQPTAAVVASLVPIAGGVALASATEMSFNWAGFLAAMGSNLTFQSRNVLSKKIMGGEKPLDNINLFSVITILACLLTFPVMLLTEGFVLAPSTITGLGLDFNFIASRALFAALCFHSYQQVSYMILARVSPVTHSIGNCVKRVVVIITSIIFFATPVSKLNLIGTGLALGGVALYSQVKRLQGAKAKAA